MASNRFQSESASSGTRLPPDDAEVSILVGADQVKYVVPKASLCAASKFFKATFNGTFFEAATQELKLPEDEPDVIKFLCDWLYVKSVPEKEWSPPSPWEPDTFWLEVYIAADKFMMHGVKTVAFDKITSMFTATESTIPSPTFIDALYQHRDAEALHTYIAGHITYWMPKAARKCDWLPLLQRSDRLAAIVGTTIADQAPEHPVFAHPGADADFADKNGHGLSEEDKKKRPGTWGVAMQTLRVAAIDQTCVHACYGVYVPGNPPSIVDT
ncbi:hypothetical protein Z517_03322 [Fonsecaea pedrosoi CBS 271.37]|uniref:BTB domain-containing protein n=1 Tax=Fonsecaea pedrosoi CBS 271.37 TaxID=1442368 RepID=A0A0D2E216_9EURO|nr:uncharacterized protein Z517_03322 [Fonsecaea pedrosoi CBS 271.37]KIW84076.1 hypothetical protein Z517_03322 [Fonsecaea pedrosoi CBS 271.37]